MSPQSKVDMSILIVDIPQASVDPALISEGTILALPVPSNWIVMSIHATDGITLSSTVTTAVHVSVCPMLSVTVKVTVTGVPTSAHVKVSGLTDNVTGPSASLDPPSTSAPEMVTFPAASNWAV